jgi:hypothetical protein
MRVMRDVYDGVDYVVIEYRKSWYDHWINICVNLVPEPKPQPKPKPKKGRISGLGRRG